MTDLKLSNEHEYIKADLVVSHFEKDFTWAEKCSDKFNLILYNKGTNIIQNSIRLPNIGREPHTFLHHIVENYDNLPNWTVFTQDEPHYHFHEMDNMLLDFHSNVEKYSSPLKKDNWYYLFGRLVTCDKLAFPDTGGMHLDILQVWNVLFESSLPENFQFKFVAGMIHAASKEAIRLRSKEFYNRALELSSIGHNPWIFERLIYYIFNENFKAKL